MMRYHNHDMKEDRMKTSRAYIGAASCTWVFYIPIDRRISAKSTKPTYLPIFLSEFCKVNSVSQCVPGKPSIGKQYSMEE